MRAKRSKKGKFCSKLAEAKLEGLHKASLKRWGKVTFEEAIELLEYSDDKDNGADDSKTPTNQDAEDTPRAPDY